jgi:glycogen debranching enzyme
VYEYQWLWDSCFHALVYRHFDGAMAWDELISLIQHQVKEGADAGMIPHMAYWQGDGTALWGQSHRSLITQPPLIAVAAWDVHQMHPNRNHLETLYPALKNYHAWFDRRRDPDNDNLVTLIHPWESGWDASPRWDAFLGLQHPTADESKMARHMLVETLIVCECDVTCLQSAGSFAVEAADFNAIRAADLLAMADIAQHLGYDTDALHFTDKAEAVQRAVQQKILCSHDDTFIAHDLFGGDEQAVSPDSAAKFVLLFGGCVDEQQARQLINELEQGGFNTPYPVPTTPTTSPDFAGNTYWRGNVWLAVNWLIMRGLQRYGYDDRADYIATRSCELVEKNGFYEYFDPVSGAGQGPSRQSWSTIMLDMIVR